MYQANGKESSSGALLERDCRTATTRPPSVYKDGLPLTPLVCRNTEGQPATPQDFRSSCSSNLLSITRGRRMRRWSNRKKDVIEHSEVYPLLFAELEKQAGCTAFRKSVASGALLGKQLEVLEDAIAFHRITPLIAHRLICPNRTMSCGRPLIVHQMNYRLTHFLKWEMAINAVFGQRLLHRRLDLFPHQAPWTNYAGYPPIFSPHGPCQPYTVASTARTAAGQSSDSQQLFRPFAVQQSWLAIAQKPTPSMRKLLRARSHLRS
ncbi:hypothetical protein KIN20_033017 [Parelaphostrongylus tenuis]|uniref:Uncharacterized protein n=1 Tax=Parelaphostrongylus tenuis TaxID=148309 RepID=A0AAD5R802_PARTN|nr:hypothetical protein KIN20_033017 [Parelaphostrongylus tenuis]